MYDYGYSYSSAYSSYRDVSEVFNILAILVAIIATIVVGIMVMPENKRAGLKPFLQKLHDLFNFKALLVEKVMKYLYVLSTLYVISAGFFNLLLTFM